MQYTSLEIPQRTHIFKNKNKTRQEQNMKHLLVYECGFPFTLCEY